MNSTSHHDFLVFFGLALFGLMLFGCIYYAVSDAAPTPSVALETSGPTTTPKTAGPPANGRILLKVNEGVQIGMSKIIYRGLDDDARICLDVVKLELDPKTAYPYRLLPRQARKGFRLIGREFRLLSAGKALVRMQLLPTARES